jgi:hypothetical protein
VLAEDWLGRPLAAETDPAPALRRYLAAFGPASVADMRTWSGLAGLRDVVERMRPGLRTFTDERGRELLDVPDGLWADPATPAPPRFLPTYDNAVLSHDDRARIVPADLRWAQRAGDALFLVDGFVRGSWGLDRSTGTLRVGAFTPLAGAEREAVAAEAEGLRALLGADAVTGL